MNVSTPASICMYVQETVRNDVRVLREALTLREEGFRVCIVDVEWDRSRPAEEEIQGLEVRHIFMPAWFVSARFKPWFLVKLARVLFLGARQLLAVPADVYHAHDDKALPACYVAARLRKKPLVFDAHELPLAEYAVKRWPRLCRAAEHLLRKMLASCTGVITVSAPIAREIHMRFGGPEVTLVRNIPPQRKVAQTDRLRKRLGLAPEVRIALYQGNLQLDRGLDSLIEAAAFLAPQTVIVMMGKGRTDVQFQLERLIERADVADRVRIIPAVSYAELFEWTASADLGLIIYAPQHSPNVRMCLPNKLFEYLMAGVPVLASHLDAVGELIEAYDVGHVVHSLSPQSIAAAINTLVADAETLTRLRHNALKAVQHDLCWEKERKQLTRLYHTILESR